MSTRQDAFNSLDMLHSLHREIGLAGLSDTRLEPFLSGVLKALTKKWPEISRAEVYLRADGQTVWRAAGIGIPAQAAAVPDPGSPAGRALESHETVLPTPHSERAQWALPLLSSDGIGGVLALETPQDAPGVPAINAMLPALIAPLSLAVHAIQTGDLTRALVLSRQLSSVHTPQDMIGVVASYLREGCTLIDLAIYETEDEQPIRVRSVVRSLSGNGEQTDFVMDMNDYPLSAAIPALKQGQTLRIDDIYVSPLIAATKHAYFRAQEINGITLLPLLVEDRLTGALMIAGRALSANELRGLQTLAGQIAVLLQNQALLDRTARALDEVQQLYRFGSAILHAEDPASLVQSLYNQFNPPPDELSLYTVHLNPEGHPLAFTSEAAISHDKSEAPSTFIDIPTHGLETFARALEGGTPLLINNLKTDPSLTVAARAYFSEHRMQAVGAFPIFVQGKLTHTITASYFAPHIYTAGEIRLLHQLSEQIGLELRNWELLRQTREQTDRLSRQLRLLESLYETSRQVSSTMANREGLQATCANMAQTLDASYAALLRLETDTTSGQLEAEYPPAQPSDLPIFQMEGTGIYKHLQTYHSALVIKLEASDLLGPHRAYFQQRGVVSILIAPLLAQGELIGMLFLGTNNPAQTFNQEDLHATQAIATQIAISLRNAELFSEIQHRATQLEQIAAFGRTVASTFEYEEIYTRIAEVVPYLLPSDRVSLALYSAGKPQMHMVTMTGKAERQEFDRPAAGSSIEEVVGTEKPLLVPELQSSSYSDHQEMAQQGFNSALIAPLVVGQRILGAVIIEHKRSHRFTLTDLTLLQQVGNQIAIALENARLFGATRQRAAFEESLSEITSRLQQQSDLRDLLYQTMYDLGHTLGARRARVRLRPQVGPNGSNATQLEE